MSRDEHLEWCKKRALEYAERGDFREAITSMLSDISKHPETKSEMLSQLGVSMMVSGLLNTRQDVIRFIEGFN